MCSLRMGSRCRCPQPSNKVLHWNRHNTKRALNGASYVMCDGLCRAGWLRANPQTTHGAQMCAVCGARAQNFDKIHIEHVPRQDAQLERVKQLELSFLTLPYFSCMVLAAFCTAAEQRVSVAKVELWPCPEAPGSWAVGPSNSGRTFGHGPRWIAALGGPPPSGAPVILAVPFARTCPLYPCACDDGGCSRARLRP